MRGGKDKSTNEKDKIRIGALSFLPFAFCHLLLLHGSGSQHRVLRGGAFNNNDRNVRCAYRNRNNPNNRNRNNGFRIVVLTFFGIPELPGALSNGIPGRGEKWRSLLRAPCRLVGTGANNNRPAPCPDHIRDWGGALFLLITKRK